MFFHISSFKILSQHDYILYSQVNHSLRHEGQFYRIQDDVYNRLFEPSRYWIPNYHNTTECFQERCIMVRKPALEVIHYLKNADYSHPVVRYILCKKFFDTEWKCFSGEKPVESQQHSYPFHFVGGWV